MWERDMILDIHDYNIIIYVYCIITSSECYNTEYCQRTCESMNQDEADLLDNLETKYYAASRPFGTKDMFGQKQSCQTPTEKMGMSLVCGISEKTLVKRMYLKLGQKATNHKHI